MRIIIKTEYNMNAALKYSRNMTPAFFAGATHDDVKWTINYLINLLEKPELGKKDVKMSVSEARAILSQRKLKNNGVPADFNGMRDEVNQKYL